MNEIPDAMRYFYMQFNSKNVQNAVESFTFLRFGRELNGMISCIVLDVLKVHATT